MKSSTILAGLAFAAAAGTFYHGNVVVQAPFRNPEAHAALRDTFQPVCEKKSDVPATKIEACKDEMILRAQDRAERAQVMENIVAVASLVASMLFIGLGSAAAAAEKEFKKLKAQNAQIEAGLEVLRQESMSGKRPAVIEQPSEPYENLELTMSRLDGIANDLRKAQSSMKFGG